MLSLSCPIHLHIYIVNLLQLWPVLQVKSEKFQVPIKISLEVILQVQLISVSGSYKGQLQSYSS